MGVILGIDIGGSSTKIVGLRPDLSVIDMLRVKADDPLTSLYGAMGNFLSTHDLQLSDIRHIALTGVGASYVEGDIYGVKTIKVAEFPSVGTGGLALSGKEHAVVVSMGTGTSFLWANKGQEVCHLIGSGVGGGTLIGLSKKLLDMDTVTHITELAEDGDLSRVDLRINDISSSPAGRLTETMTASNFGNISDLATKSDIALGIINLVFETIGMVSIFAARNHSIRNIVSGAIRSLYHISVTSSAFRCSI